MLVRILAAAVGLPLLLAIVLLLPPIGTAILFAPVSYTHLTLPTKA